MGKDEAVISFSAVVWDKDWIRSILPG